jgi:hypothetical protein
VRYNGYALNLAYASGDLVRRQREQCKKSD